MHVIRQVTLRTRGDVTEVSGKITRGIFRSTLSKRSCTGLLLAFGVMVAWQAGWSLSLWFILVYGIIRTAAVLNDRL